MGLGGISIWQLLIILVIVVLLFGTKRLGSMRLRASARFAANHPCAARGTGLMP